MTVIYMIHFVLLNLWWLDWDVLMYLSDITVIHLHIEGILSIVCLLQSCYVTNVIYCFIVAHSKRKKEKKISGKKVMIDVPVSGSL